MAEVLQVLLESDDGEGENWRRRRRRRRRQHDELVMSVGLLAAAVVHHDVDITNDSLQQRTMTTWATAALASSSRETHQSHRPQDYQENVVPLYNLEDFSAHFRLQRNTVETLMADLTNSGVSEAEFSGGNEPICLEKMTLLTLWYLANQESMRGVADRFNTAKSTVHQVVKKVTHHLAHKIAPTYINWPETQQMPQIVADFRGRANFPGVIGALDGSHIPVAAPSAHQAERNTREMTHSVVLQAVCDNNRKFTNCFAGFPGSAHDARVLHNSQLYVQAQRDQHALFPSDGYHLVADTAYPQHSWLMTPFEDTGSLTAQQVRYNTKHSQTRVIIERAFGLLKGRFRRLRLVVAKAENIPDIIIACCVLHNMCLMNSDSEDFLDPEDMDIASCRPPAGRDQESVLESSHQGMVKRDYLVSVV